MFLGMLMAASTANCVRSVPVNALSLAMVCGSFAVAILSSSGRLCCTFTSCSLHRSENPPGPLRLASLLAIVACIAECCCSRTPRTTQSCETVARLNLVQLPGR
eukprot:TRINITY_DN78048_c0_g1_i1.p1 TRINITY_DN78048_c0_g1~~TRINITY_DN78048_c0_g1_i1.p1  ORF type:complete len:119 (+),score=2.26 TRINITY_DN78048_c0_g1_i1:47-358(+)